MTLKELLEVLPDDCEIGIADFSKDSDKITYGNREYAILSFAERKRFITEQVKNMDVVFIHPCARVYCPYKHVFGDDMPELHAKPELLIEIL